MEIYGIKLFFKEMDIMSQVQILDKAVCTSLHTNVLEKGMSPFVFLPVMSE